MTSDQTFNQQIDASIVSALDDVELSIAFTDSTRGIETPAVVELARKITEQLPETEADLKRRFGKEGDHPDQFLPEAVMGLVQVAWNYGFRAGRIFQARGYQVPGEDR